MLEGMVLVTVLPPESSPVLKAPPSSLPPTLHPRLAESSTSQLGLVLRRVLGAPWRAAGASKEALTNVGTTGFQAFLHAKLNPPGPWLEDVLTHGQIPPRTLSCAFGQRLHDKAKLDCEAGPGPAHIASTAFLTQPQVLSAAGVQIPVLVTGAQG